MKKSLIPVLAVLLAVFSGCTTPVAIDPQSGQVQNAKYQAGFFYAPLDAPIGQVFNVAIRELDSMGYFRTGELHKANHITIYARKVGDERITLRSYIPEKNVELQPGQSMLRSALANLATSPSPKKSTPASATRSRTDAHSFRNRLSTGTAVFV